MNSTGRITAVDIAAAPCLERLRDAADRELDDPFVPRELRPDLPWVATARGDAFLAWFRKLEAAADLSTAPLTTEGRPGYAHALGRVQQVIRNAGGSVPR